MSSSGGSATLGTMNLTLRLLTLDEKLKMAVIDDVAPGDLDDWTLDGDILRMRGTFDRIKVLQALDKHREYVVVQRLGGS